MKKLIVNADDFGQSPEINAGIIMAFEESIVTSASLMVRYDDAKTAASYAKQNPDLGVGLHLDFGEWHFVENGWKPLYEVVNLHNERAVADEIEKQLEMFFLLLGKAPTHIDSHQHVHCRKEVRDIVLAKAKELGVVVRHFSNEVQYCGFFYGQHKDGSSNHEAISVAGLKLILSSLDDGVTELACHPASGNNIPSMYNLQRSMELETLTHPGIRSFINEQKIELTSFAGIKPEPCA